jgi:hypothetical protein
MTDRELLELALKLVSKYHARETILVDWEKAVIEAIRARLAEDDDEPSYTGLGAGGELFHLYRRPQPKAVLTDEEIDDVIKNHRFSYGIDASAYTFARAIERKIWEKAE